MSCFLNRTVQKLDNIQRLHDLIQLSSTGSSLEISVKLNIPKRTIQRYINELREMGADIVYDESRKSYFFRNEFHLEFVFKVYP